MKNLLDDLRDWFVIVLLLLGFFLAWGAGHYRDLAVANAKELKTLQGQVQHQRKGGDDQILPPGGSIPGVQVQEVRPPGAAIV